MDSMDAFKKQASDMSKSLSQKDIVVDEGGIRVVISGTQEIKEFAVEGISNAAVIGKLNKAIQLSQKAAATTLAESAFS